MALGILVSLTSLVLDSLNRQQARLEEQRREQLKLHVATVALQTGQENLVLDGLEVNLVQSSQAMVVYVDGEEVMRLVQETPEGSDPLGMPGSPVGSSGEPDPLPGADQGPD